MLCWWCLVLVLAELCSLIAAPLADVTDYYSHIDLYSLVVIRAITTVAAWTLHGLRLNDSGEVKDDR